MRRHWPAVGAIALGGVAEAEVRYGVDRLVPSLCRDRRWRRTNDVQVLRYAERSGTGLIR